MEYSGKRFNCQIQEIKVCVTFVLLQVNELQYGYQTIDDRISRLTLYFLRKVELSTNPPEGIVAGPISEDNIFVWEACIL
jgi:hypothetical protein